MDYSLELGFLKVCADRKSSKGKAHNVAKMSDGAIIVTSEDMLCLQEGESITSEVIDCYLQILEQRSNACADGSNRHILTVQCAFGSMFNPSHGLFFEDQYFKQMWKSFSYMWKGVNFLSVDKVYIPWYTESTTHWSLVVVNKLQRRFEYYNSWLQDTMSSVDFFGIVSFIRRFIEWQSKQEGITALLQQSGIKSTTAWDWVNHTPALKKVGNLLVHEIPGQRKLCDCGVHICMYVKYLSEARPWDFTHQDVPTLRLMMVRDILGFSNLWSGSESYQPRAGVDTSDDVD
jgi:Ulp1 family protease